MARGGVGSATININTVAINDEVNTINLNFTVPTPEITAFSDEYQNVVSGKPALTLDVAGSWDGDSSQGDATIFEMLGGAAKPYHTLLDGTNGYNGFAVVSSYSITASTTDAVKYTAAFQHNGKAAAIDGDGPTQV